jgi:hypothetical protein
MIFEGLDGLLGAVTAVIVHLLRLHGFFELVKAFVVKDVMLGDNSNGMQMVDELLICPNHFSG